MTGWYDHWIAKTGLRIAGLMLLASAWPEENILHRMVMEHPAAGMSVGQYLLGALLFLSATSGAALTAMGPRLWKPVPLSARWSSNGRK
ncbi:hypothetical protein [Sphingobium sp. Sx8-8]|uniref:hypothetical protein n=1 Tax=Sphingobium sp. Sx8-8 TaxID=2933617 RepID=UPI001F57EAE5|nr:hypothetical protein [Sphingobium sp. Sx8-8]